MKNTLLIPGLENRKASPDFSRLRDAMTRTGKSDRLPFVELGVAHEIMEAVLGRKIEKTEDRVEFWYRTGYDAFCISGGMFFPSKRKTSQTAQGDRSWWSDDVAPIKTRKDFEEYEWPDPEAIDHRYIEETAALLPDGMGLLLQSGGVLEFVMSLMGFTTLAEALYDDPELVADMFEQVGIRVYRALEMAIDYPKIGGLMFGDDLGFKTSTMIGRDHLRQYLFPHLKKIVDLAHSRGKFLILHACGFVENVMDDLIDHVGIDAKHSFEDAIMPVAEFKKRYGHRIGVAGGIDVDALARMEADDFRRYVRGVIEECAPGGGYALGSGNSVPNYCRPENYLAMLKAGWAYRTNNA